MAPDARLKENRKVIAYGPVSPRFYKKGRSRVPAAVRFWSKVQKTGTCWVWKAGRIGPYGSFDGRSAHAWIAKNVMGVTVSHTMVIDHACRNQLCVRPHPDHLRFVSQRMNLMNGSNPVGLAILKTHCKRGHPLFGDNCYTGNGYRKCRQCAAMRQQQYLKRKSQGE